MKTQYPILNNDALGSMIYVGAELELAIAEPLQKRMATSMLGIGATKLVQSAASVYFKIMFIGLVTSYQELNEHIELI